MADDDLTFDFEHQLEEAPEPLAALPVSMLPYSTTSSSRQDQAVSTRKLA